MALINRKVLSQGQLDGACLLYSIMNAYKTLTNDNFDNCQKKWKGIISTVNSPLCYLNGEGSDGMVNDKEQEKTLTLSTIHNAFNLLNSKKHNFTIKEVQKSDLKEDLDSNSVLIFCILKDIKSSHYKNRKINDHWVCAIGKNKKDLFVQCSYVVHEVQKYEEIKIEKKHKYYNESIKLSDLIDDKISKLAYRISKR